MKLYNPKALTTTLHNTSIAKGTFVSGSLALSQSTVVCLYKEVYTHNSLVLHASIGQAGHTLVVNEGDVHGSG